MKALMNNFKRISAIRIPPKSEEAWILQNCRKSDGLFLKFTSSAGQLCWEEGETKQRSFQRNSFSESQLRLEKPINVADRKTGRFSIIHKRVEKKPYTSKYILLDNKSSRACQKHRLYIPGLRVKTKCNLVPNFKVTPPKRCLHELKSIVSNKLILLLEILKECELAGGVSLIKPEKFMKLRDEFSSLLEEEAQATLRLSMTLKDLDQPSTDKVGSHTSKTIIGYETTGRVSKQSMVKISGYQEHRNKQVLEMLSLKQDASVDDVIRAKNKKRLEKNKFTACKVCLLEKEEYLCELRKQAFYDSIAGVNLLDLPNNEEETVMSTKSIDQIELQDRTDSYQSINQQLDEMYEIVNAELQIEGDEDDFEGDEDYLEDHMDQKTIELDAEPVFLDEKLPEEIELPTLITRSSV